MTRYALRLTELVLVGLILYLLAAPPSWSQPPPRRTFPAHHQPKLWVCPFSPNGHADRSACQLWTP
jgi:hypothetical protein